MEDVYTCTLTFCERSKDLSDTICFVMQEYEELQAKLIQLRFKEKELLESRFSSTSDYHSFSTEHPTDLESLASCTTPTSSSSRTSSTTCDVPGSPVTYAHVRVYLPNKQRTAVSMINVYNKE